MSSDRDIDLLLAECAERDISLWSEDGQIRLRGPKGGVPTDLLDRIRQHKPALIERLPGRPVSPAAAAPIPALGLDAAPLSPTQRRLWVLSRLEDGAGAYTMPLALRLDGPLDEAAFEAALVELLTRQTALRTVIVERDGSPWQEVRPVPAQPLERIDLGGDPDSEAAFLRLARARAALPFVLSGALFRALLCRIGPNRHGLLLAVHHLVSDYRSMGLMMRDLGRAYARRVAPTAATDDASPPPLRYTDVAHWQSAKGDDPREAQAVAAAAAILEGAPPLLTLPWDRPRPPVPTNRGRTLRFAVPATLARDVAALGRKAGATPFMSWLGLWGLLLGRLSGQNDVSVGCPVAERPAGTEETVGLFLTTAAMRVRAEDNPPLSTYLERTRTMAQQVLAHQDAPFERLVERLAPERSLDHTPLFQTMFLMHEAPRGDVDLPGLRATPCLLDGGGAEFDLTLFLEPTGDGGLDGYVEYATDLFDAATIQRWSGHLLTLAAAAVRQPDCPVLDLPLLTEAERERLTRSWSGATIAPRPVAALLPEALRRAGHAWSDRIAIADEGGSLDYAGLERRARAVAAALREAGIAPGSRVGVLVPRGRDWIAALWGVWRSGSAFVALDPALPAPRLSELATRAGLGAILADDGNAARLEPGPWRVLRLGAIGPEPVGPVPDLDPAPDDEAYVVFTSGSTGQPKGIRISHAALAFHAESTADLFGLEPGEAVLQFASPGFDVAMEEVWPTLIRGGRVVICPDPARDSLAAFTDLLEAESVALANLPARFWDAWTTHLGENGLAVPPALRLLVTGSEAVDPATLRAWTRLPGGACRVLSGYGPSEATVTATFYDPDRDGAPAAAGPLPLGRPLPGVVVSLLDPRGQTVPPGSVGELYLGGPGLALGYLDPVDPDPFGPDPARPGQRLYRTGDRARLRPQSEDGPAVLLFEGRADRQIKRRGFRIEPGEIEAALLALGGIALAVVVAATGGRLVALVEAAEGTRPDPEDLQRALAARLPAHLLPDAIRIVERLPRFANGKPDLPAAAALARDIAEESDGADAPGAGAPPLPGPQSLLAEIWARVLAVPRVRQDDNFFRLGGDSILALRVVSLAARAGLALSPRDLFQARTLAELAERARSDGAMAAEQGEITGEIAPLPIMAWLKGQPAPLRDGLTMSLALTLPAPVETAILRRAVQALLRHHDMLRLTLTADGRFRLRPVDPAEAQAVLIEPDAAGLAEALAAPFDLAAGPLFRLIRVAPDRLVLQAHHLAVDAVSWGILVEDLARLIETDGEAASLPPKTVSVATIAARLAEAARTPAAKTALALAERQAAELSPLARPSSDGDGKTETVELSLDLAAGMRRPDEWLLAGLGLALAQSLGRHSWLVEIEGHGRDLPAALPAGIDLSRTIGWFTTMSPARFDLGPAALSDPAAQALAAARQALRRARHRADDFAMVRLCDDPALVRRRDALAPADLLFNYLGALDRDLPRGIGFDDRVAPLLPPQPLSHPLEVNAMIVRGRVRLRLDLSPARWPPGFGPDLAARLPAALAELAARADDDSPVPADFPLADRTGLDPVQLARLVQDGAVSDIFPLTPLQRGMLFHTLRDESSGTYFDQFTCRIDSDGSVTPERFRAAWERAIARHDALSCAFFWDGPPEPLQAVRRQVRLPLTLLDWRDLSEPEQDAAMIRLQKEDRARPFDLSQAPLMRLALCRTGETSWRMLWSNHHLILDGWSLPLLLDEVRRRLADPEGRVAEDESPAPSFGAIVGWLARRDDADSLAFWQDDLAGFDTPTPLPLAGVGGDPDGWPQDSLSLGRAATRTIEAALRRRGLTLSSLIQGAWALLLSRHGGGRDVLFGVTVSGRPSDLPGADKIVGSTINTLPARVRIPRDSLAADWLAELRDRQAQREAHGHLDLGLLTRQSALPPGAQLFDSLVLVQTYPLGELGAEDGAGVRLSGFQAFERTDYGLTLVTAPESGDIRLALVYDPARFEATRCRRLLGDLRTLMLRLCEEGDRPLDAIEMLGDEQSRQMIEDWSGADRALPWQGPWHGLFEAHADRRPDAAAILFGDSVTTYRALDQRANRLAHRLQALGVGPESFVGVWLDRSPEMVVAVMGVLKAGGAYVPLDPDYPADRLALMIEDTNPPVVVTQSHLLPRMPALGGRAAILLDHESDELAALPATPPPCAAGPDNVAFIVYTSGSTGRPKGSLTLHRGLTNLAQIQTEHFGVGPDSRVLQFFSLSFDAFTWEMLMALGSGAALAMGSPRELLPGPPLVAFLARHRVTHMTLTPSALAVLPPPAAGELPDLATVITGGEGCEHGLAGRWATGGRRFFHGYGPSETTICCSAHPCDDFSGPLPLGFALPNMRMYVLDDRLRPCPIGAVGEIHIGGIGVTRGYLNRPELTAEKFLPDPFSPVPGATFYKSGDLGRLRPDGSIEFAGRVDQQVKIRGYRIEPGEIETALRRDPEVAQAAIVVDNVAGQSPRLLAYVVASDGAAPDPARLIDHIRASLPVYMVPAHLIVLPAFPLTINNKIDVAALPRPAAARSGGTVRVPPATPLEQRIAAVWAELLELPEIGADENFFDLGGNSLLVVRTCSALNRALGSDLTVVELFDLPTVRQLAARLESGGGATATARPDPSETSRSRQDGQDRLSALRQRRSRERT